MHYAIVEEGLALQSMFNPDLLELLQNKGVEQGSPSPARELGGGCRYPLLNARIDNSQN